MATDTERIAAVVRAEIDAHLPPSGHPFDVHSHTGRDLDGSARSCAEHVADLERIGGRSVVFPLCVTTGYPAENDRVVAECRRHPDRLVPFARLDPRRPDPAAEARAALAAGACGLKLHPRAEAFALDHPGVDALLAVASEAGVPVVVHAGLGVGALGRAVVDLARRHRGCRLILAHAGVSDLGWLWREAGDHHNLFFDTAWWNPVDLLALFALVPPGRILWGSDAPYGEVDLGLALTLRCARFAGLDDDQVELVAGGQLERQLAGEPPVDAGPAPGTPDRAPAPDESRLLSWLTGVGGGVLAGGDPTALLELAAVVAASWRPAATSDETRRLVVDLIGSIASAPESAQSALILALALAATPGLETAAAAPAELGALTA